MHDVCLKNKTIGKSFLNHAGLAHECIGPIKSKSHLVYLTFEHCFLVETVRISLLSGFSDYLRKCPELFLVGIITCLTLFCPFD